MAKAKPKAKKKAVIVLPRKMSALIKIALRDIRRAEEAEFIVNMSTWYMPNIQVECRAVDDSTLIDQYTTCSMCAAGSVMRFSLANEKQKKLELTPDMFAKNDNQLEAIDSLRMGDVGDAAGYLEFSDRHRFDYFKYDTVIPDYSMDDPEPFHKAMAKLQVKLEKAGL